MYYLKPAWLNHSDGQKHFEVYSVHVHPDGTRLASGGLDAKVRIWSTAAIYDSMHTRADANGINSNESNDKRKHRQRQLCSMSTHSGAVTVVRFSPSGRYLASGSDDQVILVWERDDEGYDLPKREFGAQGETDTEKWTVRRRCVGHDNDVQDLAWAPDSSILVSVGLDSGIIIWSGVTFERIKRLDIHQSHVKGITFDPANRYFATASDDRTIKIVRYHRTSGTDMTFSIDTTVSAPFEGSPLTTYFRRCSWSPDGSHIAAANATNGPVATVAIVNRGLWDSEINLIGHEGPVEVCAFSPRMFSKAKGSKQLVTVIACAGQDRALSVWNTSNPRPIVVSQNMAEKAITDLAWAPDGQRLFASSLDGSILVCVFEEGDLGYIILAEENEKQLAKYGGGRETMNFPESVDQLALEELSAKNELEGSKIRIENSMKSASGMDISSAAASKPITVNVTVKDTSENSSPAQPLEAPSSQRLTQKVSITKEGRKRVTPLLLSGSGLASSSSQPVPVLSNTVTSVANAQEYSDPSTRLPVGGISSLVLGNKRKFVADATVDSKTNASIRPSILSPATSLSQVRLSTPKVKSILVADDHLPLLFEVRNGNGGEKEPTRLTLQRRGRLLWSNYIAKTVVLITGNKRFLAAACEDATIYIYSSTGRVLVSSIVLDSTPAFLDSAGTFLLCLTSTGLLHTWNISSRMALHAPVSVAPILDSAVYTDSMLHNAPSITKCSVTVTGSAIVTLDNGEGYTYSASMLSWQRVSEPWWAVASQYWDSSGMYSSGNAVSMIERRTDEEVKRSGKGRFLQRLVKSAMMRDGYEGIETAVSISHLENRIEAATLLGSQTELKTYMIIYAQRLAEEGLTDRLEELFKMLLGSAGVIDEETVSHDTLLCGLNKQDLLKEVIVTVGKYREVQHITVPYARLLGVLDGTMTEN
ncbi:TUP1-like enhancer of split-domain-containing protein [Lipomyces arxii]|uniref:TUP1-like enhancer of split-domain-containing protein n=1 Tax=Lipomyces arxii TaxID=56418 RepID=UPI0034CE2BBD